MAEARLKIILEAIDQATEPIRKVAGGFESMQKEIRQAGVIMTAAGGAIVAGLGLSVRAAAEAEKQMARVNTIVRTLSGDFEENKRVIMEAADASQNLAGVSNELAAVSIARLSQVTGDVNEGLRLHRLALDLSAVSGRDMESATTAVIQVLAGNTRVLKEFGIEVDKDLPKIEALALLQERVGGAADEMASSLNVQMAVFQQTFGDLMEVIGSELLPILTDLLRNHIVPIVNAVQQWAKDNPELFSTIVKVTAVVGVLLSVLGPLLLLLPTIIAGFKTAAVVIAALTWPVGLAIAGIGLLVAAGIWMWRNWDSIVGGLKELWGDFQRVFGAVVDWITDKFETFVGWISDAVQRVIDMVNKAIAAVQSVPGVGAVTGAVRSVGGAIGSLIGRQHGGPVWPGQPFLVGEKGPEIFMPSQRGTIVPGVGGINVHITINGDVTGEEVVEKVKRSLMTALKLDTRFSI